MRIVHERPSQRLHHRVAAPLYVEVGQYAYQVTDWSLGGCCIEGYREELPKDGSELDCSVALPFQGFNVSFDAKLEIIRADHQKKTIAAKFSVLGERERGLMSHFIDELVRGSMVPLEDTIQRIDVPVTPVSTKPDPNPKEIIPVRRWPVKMMVMTTLYTVAGVALMAFIALILFSNLFRLEVDTAVVTAPIEVIEAQFEGRVDDVLVSKGTVVKNGQPILRLVDKDLEREIEKARIKLSQAEAELERQRYLLDSENVRREDYQTVAAQIANQVSAELDAAKIRLDVALKAEKRFRALLEDGYSTAAQLDLAISETASARAEVTVKTKELETRTYFQSREQGSPYFDGQKFESDPERSAADAAFATNAVTLARQTLDVYLRRREEGVIRAPFDGTIVQIGELNNRWVSRKDFLVTIEKSAARTTQAYLSQEDVLNIGLNDSAAVYLPSMDITLSAQVVDIDRTQGFIDEQESKYTWRGPQDKSALVILEFTEVNEKSQMTGLDGGLPAIVIFKKRWLTGLNSMIAGATS